MTPQMYRTLLKRRPSDLPLHVLDKPVPVEEVAAPLEEIALSPPRSRRASESEAKPVAAAVAAVAATGRARAASSLKNTEASACMHSRSAPAKTSFLHDDDRDAAMECFEHHDDELSTSNSEESAGNMGTPLHTRHMRKLSVSLQKAEASITGFVAPLATMRRGYLTREDSEGADSMRYWMVLHEGTIYAFNSTKDEASGTYIGDKSEADIPIEQIKKVEYAKDSDVFSISVLFEDVPALKLSQRLIGEGIDNPRFGELVELQLMAPSVEEAEGWVRDISVVGKGLTVQLGATKVAKKSLQGLSSFSNKIMKAFKSISPAKASSPAN